MWIYKWIMTLFLSSLPLEQVIKIWDFYISTDVFSILKVGLSIIETF